MTSSCVSCELVQRRDEGESPPWDCILRGRYWDVVHSYDASLPGWLVLVARRHMEGISEMTEDESVELGRLQRDVSIALQVATGCVKTYVAQFAEALEHPHVHFHVVPRMADLPEEARGPNIFGHYLGKPEGLRVSEEERNRIALEVRAALPNFEPSPPAGTGSEGGVHP